MSPTVRRVILYAILGFALLGFGWSEGRSAEQTAEAVTYGKAVLGGHPGFTRRLASDSTLIVALRATSARFVASEGHWRSVAESLQADTLDSTGAYQAPDLPQATIALGKALAACDGVRSASDSAQAVLTADLGLCRARSDSLERAVGLLLKVRAPRWGWTVGPALLGQTNGSVHLGLAVVFGWRF